MNFFQGIKNFVSEHTDERTPSRTLVDQLGYAPESALLIIKCDDLGSSNPANDAIERAMREGVATSATLMVPAPSARTAAERCRDLDIGVHLTLTSEYPTYRWRSLTGAPSLHDADGYLPRTTNEVWAHAELADVEREWTAQIEQALDWGVDVTHLDSHMDIHELDRHYFGIYLKLAEQYRLPVRVRQSGLGMTFSSIPRMMIQHGVLSPDRMESAPWGDPARGALMRYIQSPRKGVTEFMVHPVAASEELFAYDTENADFRVADAECLVDASVKAAILAHDIHLIGFRPLCQAMRCGAAAGAVWKPTGAPGRFVAGTGGGLSK